MAELSIAEFIIYCTIGYGTFLFIFLKQPALGSIQIGLTVPGVVALIVLSLFAFQPQQSGVNTGGEVILNDPYIVSIEQRNESNVRIGEERESVPEISMPIQNKAYGLFNFLLVVLLSVYLVHSGVRLLATGDNAPKK